MKQYYPLTKEQRQIFDLVRVEGDAAASIAAIIEFPGAIEVSALRDAVAWLVETNEVLHARIIEEGTGTKQAFDLPSEGLYEVKEFRDEAEAESYANTMLGERLCIDRSLCYIVGYHTEKSFGLIIHMHHIIGDGWTVMLLGKQFASYLQVKQGMGKDQPYIYQFSDHILRNEQEQKQKQYQRDLTYWRNLYEGIGEPYLLSQGRPVQTAEAKRMSCMLSQRDSERIAELSKVCNTTPAAVFFALFAAYFDRVRTEHDGTFLMGVPFFNRKGEQEKHTAGIFVNTFAVPADVEADKSFRQNLTKLGNQLFTSMRHLNCSYNAVLREMTQGSWRRERLYDVAFNYLIQNTGEFEAKVQWLFSGKQAETLVINVSDFTAAGCFEVAYDYRTDVFCEEEIERLHSRLLTMLGSLSAQEEVPLAEAAFLPDEETELVLHVFNDTAAKYPKDKTVIELFEEQVRSTPDKVAVIFENTKLTYAELNAKANQLARRLRKLGVRPDDFVAMLTERSLEMIIGIYGILKAGGAYVPMDPSYPEERIRFMINDCKPKAVLTYHAEIKTELPVIDLADSEVWTGAPRNLPHVNQPGDLAYCIYTSGTTGKPKGVLIEHRNVVNFIGTHGNNRFQSEFLSRSELVYATNNICFDISLQDIMMPLCSGVQIALSRDAFAAEPVAASAKAGLITTPTKAGIYLGTNRALTEQVCTYMIGAEKLEKSLVQAIQKASPNAVIFNGYGPTETTCGVLYYRCRERDEVEDNIPIGQPIANTQVYILKGQTLCGIGMPGELCIAGAGVARGYLNRPELTAEKFVDNPFGEGKLYRTGDLARWLPDGNLEYLGRIDEQVKIRGFRIELGEIESSIRKIEKVKDCAVIAREDKSGEKAIYAYLVSDEEISVTDIRDTLGLTLPEYMIPAYITQIEKIPVTQNGKLDKQALPEIEGRSEREYIAPRNAKEEAVCAAFSEILGVEKAGVKDNFFELGGDSIKAIRIISKLRERGYQAAVQDVLQNLTPERMAAKIKQDHSYSEQGEVNGEVPLTPIQKAFFEEWKLAKPEHYNQSLLFTAEERIPEEGLHAVLRKLTEHHDILRAVYREGKQIVLSVRESKLYTLVTKELTSAEELKAEGNKLQSSISLEEGPLFKVGLFYVGNRSYLLLIIHHLVVDGVSWRILLEDFKTAYQQWKEGEELRLPPKTASFREWAELEAEYAGSRELERERDYWQKTEAESRSLVGLGETGESGIGETTLTLSAELTETLQREAMRAYHAEWNDILLTALVRTISAWKGQDGITVFLEGQGREPLQKPISIDRTVGWFTSVYPVNLKNEKDIETTLIETKELLRRVPNHGIGYGILRYGGEDRLQGLEEEIVFQYQDEQDAIYSEWEELQINGEAISCSSAPENRQRGAVCLNCVKQNGSMTIQIGFDRKMIDGKELCEQMRENYYAALQEIAALCSSVSEKNTASDYGEDELSNEEIEDIEEMFSFE